ncbi:MAG TPA: L-histidine N(alpha)-methyltransferase [candidate division Zixibacteria bacterium]|nr:L-histidine N(alpha)-methyltransferase [candidate division Zixibacteria bacterium]
MNDLNRLNPLFRPQEHGRWQLVEPGIWSRAAERPPDDPTTAILKTLSDQPRWLEAHYLYDDRGSDLFERICDLPEYYLTRTENSILEARAPEIIAAAPVECIVELGAGSSRKTVHLLEAQLRQRGRGLFAPVDVSVPGLKASREFVRRHLPGIDFHGLHARYEEGFRSIAKELPTLFVFLGSTVGNFTPPAFARFFDRLSAAMGPGDFLLLGADRVKEPAVLEAAYADSRGLTAEFILNVFLHINRLTGSNFDLGRMRYVSRYNARWRQIEMEAVAAERQRIDFPGAGASFWWESGEPILVEISRKFDPEQLQQQLGFFGLAPVAHYTDPLAWFSLLLFRKAD